MTAKFVLLITGLPPGNDKIRGTLSTAEIFAPQKKNFFNLNFFFFFKSAEFIRKSGSPLIIIVFLSFLIPSHQIFDNLSSSELQHNKTNNLLC